LRPAAVTLHQIRCFNGSSPYNNQALMSKTMLNNFAEWAKKDADKSLGSDH
jgi:hypothetical protein